MSTTTQRVVRDHLAVQQAGYLELLPRVELHGSIYFRRLPPPDKEEALQEMRALGWKRYLRLRQRGKDPAQFTYNFATLLARAVANGRRLVGSARAKDVLNPLEQRRLDFAVGALAVECVVREHLAEPGGQRRRDEVEEALADNTVTPPPDQAAFRIDFPAWLATLTPRQRRLIRAMARGERTLDLAREFEVCPARISQIRREFRDRWRRFCGEPVEAGA